MTTKYLIKLGDIIETSTVRDKLKLELRYYSYDFNREFYELNIVNLFNDEKMIKYCFSTTDYKNIPNISKNYRNEFNNSHNVSKIDTYYLKTPVNMYDTVIFGINHISGININEYINSRITVYLNILDNMQSFFIFYIEDIAITRKNKIIELKKRITNNKLQID